METSGTRRFAFGLEQIQQQQRAADHYCAVRHVEGRPVHLAVDGDLYPLLEEYSGELPGLFIVSQVSLDKAAPGSDVAVKVERAAGVKCERCWRYVPRVSSEPASAGLCERCQDALAQTVNG